VTVCPGLARHEEIRDRNCNEPRKYAHSSMRLDCSASSSGSPLRTLPRAFIALSEEGRLSPGIRLPCSLPYMHYGSWSAYGSSCGGCVMYLKAGISFYTHGLHAPWLHLVSNFAIPIVVPIVLLVLRFRIVHYVGIALLFAVTGIDRATFAIN
jgi:hypothetical protein